jgi:hypothetical protein
MPSVLPFAALPQPWNEAYGIPSNVQLKWVNARSADKHAIYFGTSTSPAFVKIQTENTYTPDKLTTGTYYWRIDAITGSDTIKGAVWSFTVDGAVSVNHAKSSYITEQKSFQVSSITGGGLRVSYPAKGNKPVLLTLCNIQGKKVASFTLHPKRMGTVTDVLDISSKNLSTGNYLLSMVTGSTKETVPIIIQ